MNKNSEIQRSCNSSEQNILLVEDGENISRVQRTNTSDADDIEAHNVVIHNISKGKVKMKKLQIDKVAQNNGIDENFTNRSIIVSGTKPSICRGSSRGSIQISAYELYKIKKNEKIK